METDPAESPSSGGDVVVCRLDDVATVVLTNPGKLNAISIAMWKKLAECFAEFAADRSLRCVIVRGAGGHFAAGADIEEFPTHRADLDSVMHYHQEILAPALRSVAHCPHPTLAAIEGFCVGGGLEIACQCDLRIATPTSRMGVPIGQLGFPMAPEEFRGLLAVAGRAVTLELLLEGRLMPADEAFSKGLLTRVADSKGLESAVNASVAQILRGSSQAARHNKEMLRRLTPQSEPFSGEELRAFYADWCDSPDHREGVRAFLEKRTRDFPADRAAKPALPNP